MELDQVREVSRNHTLTSPQKHVKPVCVLQLTEEVEPDVDLEVQLQRFYHHLVPVTDDGPEELEEKIHTH